MKAAAAVLAALVLAATVPAATAAPTPARRAAVVGCTAFMDGFLRALNGRRVTFERPLNITRGFFGDDGDLDVHVLSTGKDEVDGTLKCKGETFRRFEVRIGDPSNQQLVTTFKDYQEAALMAAFGWERSKSQTIVNAMSSDAAEYLRASVQRGDTYQSGKVEYHQGDTLDFGVIWTNEDHSLVIASQDES